MTAENLDKLKELINELVEVIDEIDTEEPEKKDRIEILDEYMKSLDERLFVEKDCCDDVNLSFLDERGCRWTLGYIEVQTESLVPLDKGLAPEPLFNELAKYKYAFKGKYDELFKENDND